jgi:Glucose / Sorbosone dehydrogenase
VRPVAKLAALVAALSFCMCAGASAATLHLVGEFDQPIFVTSDPGNPDRLLVVEREGMVRQVEGGSVSLFGDLGDLVSCCDGERGLLSIAVAPDFPSNGRFYAVYTGTPAAGGAEGDLHVDAFRPAPEGGGALLRDPLFSVGHSTFATHNGGQLQFGPDGNLYVSTGDGGGAGDPLGSGQNPDSLLGKILRVKPEAGAAPEIWSSGLRNPWRFSFDRANGNMVIGDVGQGAREEIDLALSPAAGVVGGAGVNYGWNCREGFIAYPGAPGSCTGAGGFTDPVFDYPHPDPNDGGAHGCAITGGYVVRDPSLGDLYGRYLYADFCIGEIRSLELPAVTGGRATGDRSEGLSVADPISFGEDACGRLYVSSNEGAVYRLEGPAPANCSGLQSAATAATGPTQATASRRVQIHLRARTHRARAGLRLLLKVSVSPCAGHEESPVQLRRGGKGVAAKPLNRNCRTHFRLRIAHRSTLRVVLTDEILGPVRSRRLIIPDG